LVNERGFEIAQAGRDIDLNHIVLRRWLKEHDGNPKHAFPGLGTMKPEHFRQLMAENCVTCSIGCSGNVWTILR
jgi:hypothetical protein